MYLHTFCRLYVSGFLKARKVFQVQYENQNNALEYLSQFIDLLFNLF